MPKLRTKRPEPTPSTQSVTVRFIDVAQPGMVISNQLDQSELDAGVVQGAYVKVQPTIRSSERAAVDTKLVRERLMAAGAVAVVIAPVVVPDSLADVLSPARPVATMTAEQHLLEWFETVKADDRIKLDAFFEANTSLGEAGL